jgi:hypothetical protein
MPLASRPNFDAAEPGPIEGLILFLCRAIHRTVVRSPHAYITYPPTLELVLQGLHDSEIRGGIQNEPPAGGITAWIDYGSQTEKATFYGTIVGDRQVWPAADRIAAGCTRLRCDFSLTALCQRAQHPSAEVADEARQRLARSRAWSPPMRPASPILPSPGRCFRLDRLRMKHEAVDGCLRPNVREISTMRASAPGSRCWMTGLRSPS